MPKIKGPQQCHHEFNAASRAADFLYLLYTQTFQSEMRVQSAARHIEFDFISQPSQIYEGEV
jgi:hypothetical protein